MFYFSIQLGIVIAATAANSWRSDAALTALEKSGAWTAAQHVFHRLRHAAVLATVPGRSFHGRKSIEKPQDYESNNTENMTAFDKKSKKTKKQTRKPKPRKKQEKNKKKHKKNQNLQFHAGFFLVSSGDSGNCAICFFGDSVSCFCFFIFC